MKIIFLTTCILISLNSIAQQTNNQGLTITTQQSADGKQYKTLAGRHVPYANTVEYLAYVPNTRRHLGQIAYIYNGLVIEVWQFVGGINDINLVKILPISGGGIPKNILQYENNAAAIAANLKNGDFYYLPISNGNYLLAIVVGGVIMPTSGLSSQNGTILLNENNSPIIIN